MKKLLYLLLLTPIIYLTSCSSSKDGLTPETQSESDFVGIWERSALGYASTEWYFAEAWYEDFDGDGIDELIMEAHWEDYNSNAFHLVGSAMDSFYNYDRYVIELHLDSTYDEYIYNNEVALHYTGNWAIDLASETIIIGGNSYPYQKTNENAYEVSVPDFTTSIEYDAPYTDGELRVTDMYEQYIRIDNH